LVNKAFVREAEGDDEEEGGEGAAPALPPGAKNYMTPGGYRRMRDELAHLVQRERPEVVRTVSWAASNGDRSENGDYIYGKRRLRELDHRIRYLMKRLEAAEVVDPRDQDVERVFFGATVVYADGAGAEHEISIMGIDEADPSRGRVSWISPIAKAMLRAREGDTVTLRTPHGLESLEILEIRYRLLD
jgi:transcription elongation factor GreB